MATSLPLDEDRICDEYLMERNGMRTVIDAAIGSIAVVKSSAKLW